jgi:hypothetical protein
MLFIAVAFTVSICHYAQAFFLGQWYGITGACRAVNRWSVRIRQRDRMRPRIA